MKTMHLFAGGGGGMYSDLILGHTPTVAVEWEKAACDVLRARKQEWWPDCEIIEGDIRAFSGVRYAGEADCIHAGFPCQDLSVAGKRAGLDGDRSSLYVEALRIFREVRPRYLFLENVTGILSANAGEAHNRVMSDLASLGLDARWLCVRAADVGAVHLRDRWWLLAYPSEGGCAVHEDGLQRHAEQSRLCNSRHPQKQNRNTNGLGREDSRRHERTPWWMDEPPITRVVDGTTEKFNGALDRIERCGNGQVPLQAAYAWVMLGGPVNFQ